MLIYLSVKKRDVFLQGSVGVQASHKPKFIASSEYTNNLITNNLIYYLYEKVFSSAHGFLVCICIHLG